MAVGSLFRITFWGLAACGLVYALAMGALTHPVVQRNATYVHKYNPTRWQDLNNTEQFGFLSGQIQPFTVTTADNQTLFAWHILPLHLYDQHERALRDQADPGAKPFEAASQNVGLQLLLNDPRATVVVNFHGNAAHLASNCRPAAYQQALGLSTPEKPVHVIAFDYRGFGLSTGSPTEEGLIQDSISLLSALTGQGEDPPFPAALQPSQLILLGQSMGTFFSSAAYREWVIHLGRAPFKGLVLIASFSSLTSLVESYSFKGLTPPLMSPLLGYPRIQDWLRSKIMDKWDTSSKLVDLGSNRDARLRLVMLHARDDWEIPWREGRTNWDNVLNAATGGKLEFARNMDHEEWRSGDGSKHLRWERLRHGGHNRLQTSEQVRLALWRLIQGE